MSGRPTLQTTHPWPHGRAAACRPIGAAATARAGPRQYVLCVAAALSLLALVGSALAAPAEWDERDARFLQGLRDRRLFSLAEAYCHRQLDESQPTLRRGAQLTVELVRSDAEHARHSPTAQRDRLWQAAHQAVLDFQQANPQSPFGLLVGVQDALALLARGQLAQEEAELRLAGALGIEPARDQLRTAIRALQALQEQIEQQIPLVHRAGPAAGQSLTADELHTLHDHVQLRIAEALRTQARSFPADGADFVDALTQSLGRLQGLSISATTEELRWRSRLEQLACYRMLRRFDEAGRLLAQIQAEGTPQTYAADVPRGTSASGPGRGRSAAGTDRVGRTGRRGPVPHRPAGLGARGGVRGAVASGPG